MSRPLREFPSPLQGGERDGEKAQCTAGFPLPDPPPQAGREFATAIIQELTGGRLHLSQGPIDVVLKGFGAPELVARAHGAAARRFPEILPELCAELPRLRARFGSTPAPQSAVGHRMFEACRPFRHEFITPMAAVAGAVADELISFMQAAGPLKRAYVNDGGDIAVFCGPGEVLDIGIAGSFDGGPIPAGNGIAKIRHGDGVCGVATSGARGRSFSLGIADSVTVLAASAASADAAATMIANAVNCEDSAIERRAAIDLDPDSDLGRQLVTVRVSPLPIAKVREALQAGCARALGYRRRGLIIDAALTLQGETVTLSEDAAQPPERVAS